MHTNGANQTPRISQFHIIRCTSSLSSSHPSANVAHTAYRAKRVNAEGLGADIDRDMPRVTARSAAREKFTTEVTDMSVLQKQRDSDLRRTDRGAWEVGSISGRRNRLRRGSPMPTMITGSTET